MSFWAGCERLNRDVLRSEVIRNDVEYLCVALCGVVETGRVDQRDCPVVELELLRVLDLVCARHEALADAQRRVACNVYELECRGFCSQYLASMLKSRQSHRRLSDPSRPHHSAAD